MVDVVIAAVAGAAADVAANCRGEVLLSVPFSSSPIPSVDESFDKSFFASCTLALVPFPSVPSWPLVSSSPKTAYFNCCVLSSFSSCDDANC